MASRSDRDDDNHEKWSLFHALEKVVAKEYEKRRKKPDSLAKMFELRLTKGALVKRLLNLFDGMIANEVIIEWSSTAILVQAEDWLYPGTYLVLHLSSNFFDHFLCDQSIFFALKFHDLCPILDQASDGNTVTIKKDSGSDTISFTIESHAIITVTNKRVKLSNEAGIDNGNLDTNWQDYIINYDVPEDIAIVNTNLTDPVSFTFGLQRIDLVKRASFMSDTVLISMSSGLPLVLEYKIEQKAYIRFYLS